METQLLLRDFVGIFSLNDLDLGKISLMKHEIRLKNTTPLKMYRRIPPGVYEEVRAYIQERLEIGSIRPPSSPLTSPVVLIRKMDSKLRFCIDLCKLNK